MALIKYSRMHAREIQKNSNMYLIGGKIYLMHCSGNCGVKRINLTRNVFSVAENEKNINRARGNFNRLFYHKMQRAQC